MGHFPLVIARDISPKEINLQVIEDIRDGGRVLACMALRSLADSENFE